MGQRAFNPKGVGSNPTRPVMTTNTNVDPNELFNESRVEDLYNLREAGMDPYPTTYPSPTITLEEYRQEYATIDSPENIEHVLVGRVRDIRDIGAISFIDISDETDELQLILSTDDTNDYGLTDHIGLGDIISATGRVERSNSGELSLAVDTWQMLTKTLRHPFWASNGSVSDRKMVEDRTNALQLSDLHEYVQTRFSVINTVREEFSSRGFTDVTTPILQGNAGGADATPFTSYAQAVEREFDLRIAPELYLKMLLAAGFGDVFEIGKSFRNEDMDATHTPEFVTVEAYRTYEDYTYMMEVVEEVCAAVATEVRGEPEIIVNGETIDISPPWERADIDDLVSEYADVDPRTASFGELVQRAESAEETSDSLGQLSRGDLIMELYDAYVEPQLNAPTFVQHHPVESSPLCQPLADSPSRLQRFEAVVGGVEIANSYTEIRDPVVQAERLYEQADTEDEIQSEFIQSIAMGMPPCTGLGIGIDRLALLVSDTDSINDVLPFPLTSRYSSN